MGFRTFIPALIFLLATVDVSIAQAPASALFGVRAAREFGRSWGSIPVMGGGATCAGEFTIGDAQSLSAGVVLAFPNLFADRLGASFRLNWNQTTDLFTLLPPAPFILFDPELQSPVTIIDEYRLQATSRLLRFDLLGTWRAANRLEFSLGPWIGYRYSNKYAVTDAIVAGETRFPGGLREIPVEGGTALTSSALALGGSAAVAYEIPFSSMLLRPELSVQVDLTSPAREAHWNTIMVGGGITLAFDLGSREQLPMPRDTIRTTSAPADNRRTDTGSVPRRPPTASLGLYGIDARGERATFAVVRVYETIRRGRTPLIPSVQFAPGSATIPERYARLSAQESVGVTIDSLAGNPEDVEDNVLNIIGARLREHERESVTITGSRSSDEPPALARARAEAVALYLSRVWHPDTSRIIVAVDNGVPSRGSRGVENDRQRVSFAARSPELLAPVSAGSVARDFDPPVIALDPFWEAEAGVREWTLSVHYNGRIIGRLSNRDADHEFRMDWRIPNDREEGTRAPILAELTVVDSLGDTARAWARLPLVVEWRTRVVDLDRTEADDRETILVTLLPFDSQSDTLSARNNEAIQEIVQRARAGAHITMLGRTDPTDSASDAERLAQRRMERTERMIRVMLENEGRRDVVIATTNDHEMFARLDAPIDGRVLHRHIDVMINQRITDAATGERRR